MGGDQPMRMQNGFHVDTKAAGQWNLGINFIAKYLFQMTAEAREASQLHPERGTSVS